MLSTTTRTATAAVSIALAVTACDLSRTDKAAGASEESHPRAKADEYKRNPSPKQRYDITMTIADAPGPFESVQWYADYEAPNCLFILDRFAGVTSRPSYRMPVHFRKVDGSTYVGAVHLDAMLDDDYFGDGVCHWKLGAVSIYLKATGTAAETNFLAGMGLDEVLEQKAVTAYSMKQSYPQDQTIEGFSEFGERDRSKFAPYITGNDLFTITLTPKEVRP